MFSIEDLEMIQAIRDINNDQMIDEYEALESYIEIMSE